MPYVELPAGRFFYRFDGPLDAPLLVLSNSLGTDHSMWEPQLPMLTKTFRVLRYDGRGHGTSVVPPGPYTIPQMAEDVVCLYEALDIRRAHYCGVSMGGMVGMWLAANAPDCVDRLVLCNTAARLGPPQLWDARIAAVRVGGMAAIVTSVLVRWFTSAFIESSPEVIAHMRQILATSPANGYIACCEAVRDADLLDILARIKAKTLVIAGSLDAASPPVDGRFLAASIASASYLELDAAHLTNIELAQPFNEAIVQFLLGGVTRGNG